MPPRYEERRRGGAAWRSTQQLQPPHCRAGLRAWFSEQQEDTRECRWTHTHHSSSHGFLDRA